MNDRARHAIAYLRTLAEEWDDDGLQMSASYMSDAADTLEAELRRCRAETLREVFENFERELSRVEIHGDANCWHLMRYVCEGMADEAEQEAGDDA